MFAPNDSVSSKFLRFAIIVSSLCLAIILRLANFSYFTTEFTGHFNFIDTDCYYQLRRLVYFLANFPKTLTFDPLADWPTGSIVDWPDGFIYVIGVPLKLFGVSDFRSLEVGACLVMIALGLLTILSIYLLARRLLRDLSLALLVLFLASTNFLLVRFSCLGEVDHHILEAIFPIVTILLSLKTFEDQKKWAAVVLGVSLTLFLWVSSSSVFTIGVFFAVYAFILGRRGDGRLFRLVGMGFFLSLIPLAVYHHQTFGSWKLLTHPSLFHLILVSLLAGLSFAVSRFKRLSFGILFVFFAIGGLLYWLQAPRVLMEPLYWAISYVFEHTGPIQNVSEAAPLFMNYEELNLNFMHLNFGYFVYLIPLAWILVFRIHKMEKTDRVLILSLAMLSVPGVFQKRFSHLMIGLFLIFLAWCLKKILAFFRENEMRIGPMFVLLFLCFSIFPGLQFGFYPESSVRDRVDHTIAQLFLTKVPVKREEVWDRLALSRPTTEAIYANPNLGHLFNYITGSGVVTNSFYHWSGFELDFKFRNIQTDQDFRTFLSQNKIRHLVLVDDFKFLEFQYRLRNLPADLFVKKQLVNGQDSTVFQMQELMKYSWVRLLLAEGDIDHFTTLSRANFLEDYFYRNMIAYRFDGL